MDECPEHCILSPDIISLLNSEKQSHIPILLKALVPEKSLNIL
jgi:hypothetical protein